MAFFGYINNFIILLKTPYYLILETQNLRSSNEKFNHNNNSLRGHIFKMKSPMIIKKKSWTFFGGPFSDFKVNCVCPFCCPLSLRHRNLINIGRAHACVCVCVCEWGVSRYSPFHSITLAPIKMARCLPSISISWCMITSKPVDLKSSACAQIEALLILSRGSSSIILPLVIKQEEWKWSISTWFSSTSSELLSTYFPCSVSA